MSRKSHAPDLPLRRSAARGVRLDVFPTVERLKPGCEFAIEHGDLRAPRPVVLFQQAQCLTNDFARRSVASGFNLAGDKLIEFGGE